MSADCENCAMLAEQNDALKRHLIDDHEKLDALVNRLASADRTIAGLKGELTKLRQDSPKMADAEKVFAFWVKRLKKNARTTFGPARQSKVIARLNEKSLTADCERREDLLWAVRGLEALPFVGPQGRQAKPARGANRHDGLELVCRDEATVERFMGYADDAALRAFHGFLERSAMRFGQDSVECVLDGAGRPELTAVVPCPVCEGPVSVLPGNSRYGDLLWLKCGSGCGPDEVKARLREPMLVAA